MFFTTCFASLRSRGTKHCYKYPRYAAGKAFKKTHHFPCGQIGITKAGHAFFKNLALQHTTDIPRLQKRQAFLKALLDQPELVEKLRKEISPLYSAEIDLDIYDRNPYNAALQKILQNKTHQATMNIMKNATIIKAMLLTQPEIFALYTAASISELTQSPTLSPAESLLIYAEMDLYTDMAHKRPFNGGITTQRTYTILKGPDFHIRAFLLLFAAFCFFVFFKDLREIPGFFDQNSQLLTPLSSPFVVCQPPWYDGEVQKHL